MCLSHSSWFPHNWTASHNINWAWMSIPLPRRVDRFWLKLGQGMYFSWDFENWSLTPLKLRRKASLSETPTCHLLDSQSNLVLPLTSPGLLIPYWSPVGILLACFHEPEQLSLARTSSTGPWFVHIHNRVIWKEFPLLYWWCQEH